jgi:hypothetical protein
MLVVVLVVLLVVLVVVMCAVTLFLSLAARGCAAAASAVAVPRLLIQPFHKRHLRGIPRPAGAAGARVVR